MRARQHSPSIRSILANGLVVLLLCFVGGACGSGGDRSEQTGGATGSGGGTSSLDRQETTVPPPSADTASADTVEEGAEGPTPIEVGNAAEFEEVDPDESSSEEEGAGDDGSDVENAGGGTTNPSEEKPPDPPDPPRSTLQIETNPRGATVTIRNQETGTPRTKETPATFEVPPGLYSWTVEKEGYDSKESRQPINLEIQREQTERVNLTSVSGGGAYFERADSAYKQEDYQRAVDLYEQVAEPGPNEDPNEYLRAQARLGRIYWKQQGNYEAAIRAYQNIVDYDDTRYEAHLGLARINFDTENYREVLDHLDQVNALKYSIPTQNQKRLKVSLEVRYLRGRALFQQAQDEQTRNRRAKALKATQAFRGFLDSVPPELESTFARETEEIQQKRENVRTLLKEEIR